jgi:5,5'-dehydrodivanillate O-demethylase oxygenase subunit
MAAFRLPRNAMLSAARNALFTEVEGTAPMGRLLRRYWQPIYGMSELKEADVRRVRFLGEDLVLFRDLTGKPGLVDRHCAHRRADLSYGFVEASGLRCNYHGWLFDEQGHCVEQPYEDTVRPGHGLKSACSIAAYPVRECAGLIWAYFGPDPTPELPVYEPFSREGGFVEIVVADVPCNWFQCQENSCDPVHFEWMHDNWSIRRGGETGPYSAKHLKLGFDEFEHGFIYRRVREGQPEDSPLWTIGRVALWPNGFYLGDHFEWRVPVDNRNTLSISWFFAPLPLESEYRQSKIPTWRGPIYDDTGDWIGSHVINQDIVAWVGQGTIADRSREHLGASDRGIAMMRNRFLEELAKLESGDDLKGLIRDPAKAKRVELPTISLGSSRRLPRKQYLVDRFFSKRLEDFPWHAGQPPEVLREYRRAVGVDP